MAILNSESVTQYVAESTYLNAVYLDKDGFVVSQKDPSVHTKISRQEALRRGLRPLDMVEPEPGPETADSLLELELLKAENEAFRDRITLLEAELAQKALEPGIETESETKTEPKPDTDAGPGEAKAVPSPPENKAVKRGENKAD